MNLNFKGQIWEKEPHLPSKGMPNLQKANYVFKFTSAFGLKSIDCPSLALCNRESANTEHYSQYPPCIWMLYLLSVGVTWMSHCPNHLDCSYHIMDKKTWYWHWTMHALFPTIAAFFLLSQNKHANWNLWFVCFLIGQNNWMLLCWSGWPCHIDT